MAAAAPPGPTEALTHYRGKTVQQAKATLSAYKGFRTRYNNALDKLLVAMTANPTPACSLQIKETFDRVTEYVHKVSAGYHYLEMNEPVKAEEHQQENDTLIERQSDLLLQVMEAQALVQHQIYQCMQLQPLQEDK